MCVCVSVIAMSSGAITSHSHHLQCKDTSRRKRMKGVCQRERVGETTLFSASQPLLFDIFAMIPHQAIVILINFVRLHCVVRKLKISGHAAILLSYWHHVEKTYSSMFQMF